MKLPGFLASFLLVAIVAMANAEAPSGDASIRGMAGGSEIVITTTSHLAGAIHSLTWNGREFIDSFDHGRQLQSAANFDNGGPIAAETFNPTEAGSRRDGVGPKSSSRLLHLRAGGSALQTVTQMAFWLAPGEKSEGNKAKSTTLVSGHLLTKRVRIGYRNLPHVISYDVTFAVPPDERHAEAVFEALTGYMPAEFSDFHRFNASRGELEPLSDGPGEQSDPIVFSVPGGTHAMAIYAPPQHDVNTVGPSYGRFRFIAAKVVKWNCVFRVRDQGAIAPGGYPFRMFVIVGSVDAVRDSLRALHGEFEGRK